MSRILLEILKHKAAKLGCFVGIGIFAAMVTVLSRAVLGWLHYDEAQQKQISAKIGDGLIRVIVCGLFAVGVIMMARQAISALRTKRIPEPPLLSGIAPVKPPAKAKPAKRRLPQ